MSRDLILIKLGGSLITDKRGKAAARVETIERLAAEIAAARSEMSEGVVLGHGSGSFGHVAAQRYGFGERHRDDDGPSLEGTSVTQDQAARLHRIVVDALIRAGETPWSTAPSSLFIAEGGRISRVFLEPVVRALDHGLLPVVYGDVVLDRRRGAVICSTEMALDALVKRFRRRGLRIRRLLWLGETDGIYDRDGRTIPRVDQKNLRETRRMIDAPSGTDVTGGMLLRLDTARSLARRGIESWIFDGRRPGALTAALTAAPDDGRANEIPGTRIVPDTQ